MAKQTAKIPVRNVIRPESLRYVDGDMYEAMKRPFLKVLPRTSPGLTATEIRERLTAHLPQTLFPGGAKAGWWAPEQIAVIWQTDRGGQAVVDLRHRYSGASSSSASFSSSRAYS
jgi:hypothetical protein